MEKILGFSGEHRFMSNFISCWVVLDGHVYPSTEHAYQAAKTLNESIRENIREARTPGVAKRIGQELALRPDWEEVKEAVMYDLLRQKFTASDLKQKLINTGDAYLEETNTWGDVYWGVCNGIGKNRLGHLLMKLRDELNKDGR